MVDGTGECLPVYFGQMKAVYLIGARPCVESLNFVQWPDRREGRRGEDGSRREGYGVLLDTMAVCRPSVAQEQVVHPRLHL